MPLHHSSLLRSGYSISQQLGTVKEVRPILYTEDMFEGDISQEVRRKRETLGWSQARLSREASVAKQTIVNLEKDHYKPRWETLQKIMHALDNAEC